MNHCCTVNYDIMVTSYKAKTSSLRLGSPIYYLCDLKYIPLSLYTFSCLPRGIVVKVKEFHKI